MKPDGPLRSASDKIPVFPRGAVFAVRGYTRKQWGLDPSELDKSVTARIPTRTNRDDRYFGDQY
jgi:UDP-galactopyranose mutase